MKKYKTIYKILGGFLLLFSVSCQDKLVDINENPNEAGPGSANPNLMLAPVLANVSKNYLNLGYGHMGGVVQHMQEDGWFSGYNQYDWTPNNWGNWYSVLRDNEVILKRSDELGMPFQKGIALTMRAFSFGMITDLWGDAPYTEALKGGEVGGVITHPKYDSQETIYLGIIEHLKEAAQLFAGGNTSGINANYDVIYGGNIQQWHRFANSLLLRYYMRLSEKLPQVAKAGVESVYQTGIYIQSATDDATHDYLGTDANNSWPTANFGSDASGFRRRKPCTTLLNVLLTNNDPRTTVWFQPVYCRWVADPALTEPVDPTIRRNGVLTTSVSLTDVQYMTEIAAGNVFTRHFNPSTFSVTLDTREYVGVPPGLLTPDAYNYNPTPGQVVENQHVSQLAPIFRERTGGVLTMRIMSAAETAFILAEAAQRGWSAGTAETHYNRGVEESLKAWNAGAGYATFITQPGVTYNGTLERIMEQKWIASFTVASEAWFDWRRTGLPDFQAGPASPQPYLPVRLLYGENESNNNEGNFNEAVNRLEQLTGTPGKNNQWSKPWIVQGTGKPW